MDCFLYFMSFYVIIVYYLFMIFLTVILSGFNYPYLGLIVEHLYVVFSITVSMFFDIYQYFTLGNYYILKLKTKFIILVI